METPTDQDVHVVPKFGREHSCSPECWCQPVKDAETAAKQPEGPHLWIHEPEN